MLAVQKRLSEYASFRDWIWELWIDSGLDKAADFAAVAGVSQQNTSQYLNGKSIPSPATVIKMAGKLGVDRDELLALAGHGPGGTSQREVVKEAPAREDAPAILLYGGGKNLTQRQKDELARRVAQAVEQYWTELESKDTD